MGRDGCGVEDVHPRGLHSAQGSTAAIVTVGKLLKGHVGSWVNLSTVSTRLDLGHGKGALIGKRNQNGVRVVLAAFEGVGVVESHNLLGKLGGDA